MGKKELCARSTLVEDGKAVCMYQPKMKKVAHDEGSKIQKFEFGDRKGNPQEKVILVLGATGAGKTTLINGMVNYIFGVEKNDKFRFKLITEPTSENQAQSQTSFINAYTIHYQSGIRVPYTLTIIDTPGFGDTRGIERDREITEQIRTLFSTKGNLGIDRLDIVGFVAAASLPRLTETQKYIFDQIQALFGHDIKDNIFLMLTFADNQKPKVLAAVREAKIPFQSYFQFNCSVMFPEKSSSGNSDESDTDSDDGDDTFVDSFWKMAEKNFEKFLQSLNVIPSKSLLLSKDVLAERNQLEAYIAAIHKEFQSKLNFKQTLEQVNSIIKNKPNSKEVTYTVDAEIITVAPLPLNATALNCIRCKRTCHEKCITSCMQNQKSCLVILDGKCQICPKKCSWEEHKQENIKYIRQMTKLTKTVEGFQETYKGAAETNFANATKEVNNKMVYFIEQMKLCTDRLSEIALKPKISSSQAGYVDLLLANEASPQKRKDLQNLKDIILLQEGIQLNNHDAGQTKDKGIRNEAVKKKAEEKEKWRCIVM